MISIELSFASRKRGDDSVELSRTTAKRRTFGSSGSGNVRSGLGIRGGHSKVSGFGRKGALLGGLGVMVWEREGKGDGGGLIPRRGVRLRHDRDFLLVFCPFLIGGEG